MLLTLPLLNFLFTESIRSHERTHHVQVSLSSDASFLYSRFEFERAASRSSRNYESAISNVKSSDILQQKYFETGINNEELLHVSTLMLLHGTI